MTTLLQEVREKIVEANQESHGDGIPCLCPLGLAEVLRAIFKSSPQNCVYAVDEVGEFHALVSTTSSGVGVYWNLSKSLDDQEEEVISFLHKILV